MKYSALSFHIHPFSLNKRFLLSYLSFFIVLSTMAQNPVIRDQFTADPTARVFNDRVYLYPSHDIPSPIERLKEWFCMADYHVFSSENLTDWQDHGVIVSQETVPWGNPEGYSMWAPDCVEKDGKYYFYFPDAPRDTTRRGFNIGVAVSNRPDGGFVPFAEPIKGIFGIDPCVMQDDDGQAYIFWAGGIISGARLASDMVSLASEPKRMEGIPKGFVEGPFAFKKDGHYYLTFPWVEDKTETLAYCMSDNPLGPWKFCGKIMEQSPTGCWTNHHSIVKYRGQWYLFYHHNDYSPKFDKNRSVRIDKLFFNADGTIQTVTPTLRGVGITNAFSPIQIDRYSAISSKGADVELIDTLNTFEGWKTMMEAGAWVEYNDIQFPEKAQTVTVNACSSQGAVLRVLLDGKMIARITISESSTFRSFPGALHAPVSSLNIPHVLRVEVESGSAEIDFLRFSAS